MSAKNSKNGRLEQRPAFPFYPQDFLASPKVRRMSMEERGAYITLLSDDWLEGGLADDPEELADRCGMDPGDFKRIWSGPVGRCFPAGADGRCRNPRLDREREHADTQADVQRLKAEFSWARRRGEVPKGVAFEEWCRGQHRQCTGNAPATPGNAPNPTQPNPTQPNPKDARGRAGAGKRRRALDVALDGEWSDEARELVTAYAAHRAALKVRALTRKAWEGHLRDAELNPVAYRAALAQSERNGWTGIFPSGAPTQTDRAKAKADREFAEPEPDLPVYRPGGAS